MDYASPVNSGVKVNWICLRAQDFEMFYRAEENWFGTRRVLNSMKQDECMLANASEQIRLDLNS